MKDTKDILKGVQTCLDIGTDCEDCPYYLEENDCESLLLQDIALAMGNNFFTDVNIEPLTAKEAASQTKINDDIILYKNNIWFIFNEIKSAIKVGARKIEVQVEDEVSERVCNYFQLLKYKVTRLAWSDGNTKVRIEW